MIAAPPDARTPNRRRETAPSERLGRYQSPWPHRRRLLIAGLFAAALHAAVYFLSREPQVVPVEFGIGDGPPTLDVELVAGAEPAVAAAESPQPPPVEPQPVEPPPPPPEPKPEPEPIAVKEEMIPPVSEPKAVPPPPAPKAVAQPRSERPRVTTSAAIVTGPRTTTGLAGTGSGRAGGGRTAGPVYLSNPKPPYPPESRAAGEEGVVFLRVSLDATGRPTNVSLGKSSGFGRLDRSAQEAVRRWRFRPAMRDGQPIPISVSVPVEFNLRS